MYTALRESKALTCPRDRGNLRQTAKRAVLIGMGLGLWAAAVWVWRAVPALFGGGIP